MDQHYVGLDVHSKQSVFAIADAAGRWVAEGEVPTTPAGLTALRERHALAPQTPVALETGTSAFFVARQLSALGLTPVVVDAHEVRVKAHRPTQKSDRRDARELCEGLRRGIYRVIVQVPSAPVARLRDSLSRRRHFVRVQTAEINAAKRLLRAAGLGQTRCTLRTESGWATRLETLDPSSDLRTYLEQHRALWRCAGEQLRALDHLLVSHQGPFVAELQRLQTIPGVGPIVAATVVAVFADVQRFPDAKHAASYAGLTPSPPINRGRAMCTGGSPNGARLNCARCCVKRPTTPPAPSIRCTPTSPSNAPNTATSARRSPWPIGCVGSCSPCCATGATST